MSPVFYKGSMEGITDVIAGRTHAMFAPASSLLMQQVKIGRLTAIAVTGATRTAAAPEVPTMAEAGLPGYEVTMWKRPAHAGRYAAPDRREACRSGNQGCRLA